MNSIDLERAFRAPFRDKDWLVKTLLGFVWQVLVITAPAVTGAQVVYLRDVSEGREALPEWSDFGGLWVKGALAWVAAFIYFLPVVVVSGVFLVPVALSAAGGGDSDALGGLLAGGTCLWLLLVTAYSIAVSLFYYAALTNFAMRGSFGAFFEFGQIMGRVRAGTGYFSAWLWALVVGAVASAITGAVSGATGGIGGVLSPAVTYLMSMITAHLFGQWAIAAYGLTAPVAGTPSAPPAYVPPAYVPPAPPAPQATPAPQPPVTPPAPPAPPAQPAPPAATAPPAQPTDETPAPE